jgi:DNA helicase IV
VQVTGTELERERTYVGRLYGRLDAVRAETREQLTAVRDSPTGGTHQNRSERDAFARIYEDRLQALREVDERLVFGRLEFEAGHLPEDEPRDAAPARTAGDGDPVYRYIGRIGLRDDDLQPLLLDWRVPQASAFYQATAATPLGARARRHLTTRGREVVHVEDEVFDPTLLDEGRTSLQGEGALLAALAAGRTGRMNDIVATIQAEQDRIIRSDLRGVLVVQGGPGTGKTAVALHRAAYLLYSHRDRLASSGVLVVGPSRSFLQYIEAVLPSLGETGVVLASVGQLFPGIEASAEDEPEVAAVKGGSEMAGLLQRAVRSRQVAPTEAVTLDVNGERLVLEPSLVQNALRRAQDSRKPHNEARVVFNRTALGSLAQVLASQMRRNGSALDDSDLAMLREDLRTSYDVKVALNTAWLPLTPEKLIQDLYARPNWLASLTPRWSPEADASAREREQQRIRDIENAEQAIENMGVGGIVSAERLAEGFAEQAARRTTAERAASDRTWTYGHIVVDEAQELSPMQWRVLLRRCPLRSFTIVGDVAQASSAVGVTSWQDALGPVLGREWRLEELTVNYRTPARIAEAAERMAIAHGLPVTRSRAVREGEHPIDTVEVDADEVVAAVVDVVDEERERGDAGTLAVIARDDRVEGLHRALAERFGSAVGIGVGGLGRPIAVLGSQEAKGLEFDVVVIAEPDEILASTSRGAAGLYVAMTRPTQRLHVVTSTGFTA